MPEVLTKRYLNRYLGELSYFKYLCSSIKRGRNLNEYKKYREWILQNQSLIKQSINKLNKEHYRKLLTMRYVYGFKWSKITEILFRNEPDFDCQKDYKYRDKAFYWNRQAIKALGKTNKEEFTAIQALKKIKKLCKAFTGMNKTENEFITEILALVGI